ncbi:hypothetical protein B9Z55_023776 [Caenorhabditis nigoni]|uniref:Uncharacterized protein n=1 Tax=Caenorhabditis nigoni TaxID=1611254 RepID=A0A2G5SRU6_9PELO|nr:hypothetical protein B9Z55_023776 [Caenorhabditis nigoni]
MTATPSKCFSCYVAQLEALANAFGFEIRPIVPTVMNLPSEYHVFFLQLDQTCSELLEARPWVSFVKLFTQKQCISKENLPEIDHMPCQTTVLAVKEVVGKVLVVGMKLKTELFQEGTKKMINFMRQIVNLIAFLETIDGTI